MHPLHPEKTGPIDEVLSSRARSRDLQMEAVEKAQVIGTPDGGVDVTQMEQQIGRPLHVEEIKRRLRKMNFRLTFELSKHDPRKIGIYVLEQRKDPITGKIPWKRFICGMESGITEGGQFTGLVPEFTIEHVKRVVRENPRDPTTHLVVNEHLDETRGWRVPLTILLKERLITMPQIEKYFQISQGRSSEKWQKVTGQTQE